jgi:tetratricopeptide (TPR) repeat protein
MASKFGGRVMSVPKKNPALLYRSQIDKVQTLLNSGDFGHAERHARELQNKHPNDVQANFLLAQILVAREMHDSAIPFAETAVMLAPFHPGTNYFLGRLYLHVELFEKAAPLLFESLKKAPNSALLHWALADMYMAFNQGETASKYYETALQLPLDDQRKLQIRNLYFHTLLAINRHAEAEKLSFEMKNTPEMSALFLLQRSQNAKLDQFDILTEQIKDELASPSLDASQRATLHHALGNVMDRSKDHHSAFEQWLISRSYNRDEFQIDAFVGTVDNLIVFYSRDMLQSLRVLGHQSEQPIFIFGMARSGTTLTEQIIGSHKDATGIGELGRMGKLEHKFFETYCENKDEQRLFRDAKSGVLIENSNEYLNLLSKISPQGAKRVADKSVAQYQAAGFIHACFPNARFIHCNRHPADSYVSAFQNRLNHDYVSNQEHYAKYYLGKEKLMAHWRTCFPDQIFDLTYEKLVQDPETIVRELITFLGLEWDPNCMKFFEQKSTVKTLSLHQVRQPIYTSSIYRWKKYEKHLGPLFAALKEANFEYPEF